MRTLTVEELWQQEKADSEELISPPAVLSGLIDVIATDNEHDVRLAAMQLVTAGADTNGLNNTTLLIRLKDALVTASSSSDNSIRAAAIRALTRLRKRVREHGFDLAEFLVEKLRDTDEEVLLQAVRGCSMVRSVSETSARLLITHLSLLHHSPSERLRSASRLASTIIEHQRALLDKNQTRNVAAPQIFQIIEAYIGNVSLRRFLVDRGKSTHLPRAVTRLFGAASVQLGTQHSQQEALSLVQPVATRTLSARPLFKWHASEEPAEYIIRISTLDGKEAHTRRIESTATTWAIPADAAALEPGTTYRWELEARMADGRLIIAPSLSQPDALFAIVNEETEKRVQALPKPSTDVDQLLLALYLAEVGVLDDAAVVLRSYIAKRPRSIIGKRLLASLRRNELDALETRET